MMRIYPRLRLDLSWRQLLFAAGRCFVPGNASKPAQRIERHWGPGSLVCFSVRTGLDLYLQAANWPRGSEVLVSAMTIPEMPRLLEIHGLKVIPIDLDPETLNPNLEYMARAINSRTRAFLYAHLFGAQACLERAIELAHRHGIEVLEDRAHAFMGVPRKADPACDAAFFSFGPIKTATALGGAIVQVKDSKLLGRMRRIQSSYPRQPRRQYFRRVLRFSCLHFLSQPLFYGGFVRGLRLLGLDHESVVRRAVRNFPLLDPARLRLQPSAPLLQVLERRLRNFSEGDLARRQQGARTWCARLPPGMACPGSRAAKHSFWLFPVLVTDPAATVLQLRARGFDASTVTTNLAVVRPTDSRSAGQAQSVSKMASQLVLLPFHPLMPAVDQARLFHCLATKEERVLEPDSAHRQIVI